MGCQAGDREFMQVSLQTDAGTDVGRLSVQVCKCSPTSVIVGLEVEAEWGKGPGLKAVYLQTGHDAACACSAVCLCCSAVLEAL